MLCSGCRVAIHVSGSAWQPLPRTDFDRHDLDVRVFPAPEAGAGLHGTAQARGTEEMTTGCRLAYATAGLAGSDDHVGDGFCQGALGDGKGDQLAVSS